MPPVATIQTNSGLGPAPEYTGYIPQWFKYTKLQNNKKNNKEN